MSAPPNDGDPRKLPRDQIAIISSVVFEQQAAVMAGLQCKYIDVMGDQSQTTKSIGSRVAIHSSDKHHLYDFMPDSALVMFGADVMWDGDPWLNRWFGVDYSSTATAHFKLTGAAGSTSFTLKNME